MSNPVYRLALARNKEAWYQLSEEEQKALNARNSKLSEDVGAERIIICDCSWSTEQYEGFVVFKFPSMEALQKHAQDAAEMEWHRYIDAESVLGTEWQET